MNEDFKMKFNVGLYYFGHYFYHSFVVAFLWRPMCQKALLHLRQKSNEFSS